MQISNLGHHNESHRVTHCMYDHGQTTGRAGAAATASGQTAVSRQTEPEPESFGWLEGLRRSLSRIRGFLWGNGTGGSSLTGAADRIGAESPDGSGREGTIQPWAGDAGRGNQAGTRQGGFGTMSSDASSHVPGVAAAAGGIRAAGQEQNPYFTAVPSEAEQRKTAWGRIRVRFRRLTGQLGRHAAGQPSLSSGKKDTPQDLRRHSRYREEELEVDCILKDDSYLLDSYDRKGAYSKLTAIRERDSKRSDRSQDE